MTRRTALFAHHQAAGARFIEFNGWEMPVQYEGILAEHQAVRRGTGVFDTSHMGQVLVRGARAGAWLDWVLPNDIAALAVGQARYTPLLAPDGGIIDDLMVYRTDEEEYLLVVNAGGREGDLAWFEAQCWPGVHLEPRYEGWTMLAVQGPTAVAMVTGLAGDDLTRLPRFAIRPSTLAGRPAWVARTGYTGEDGVELFVRDEDGAVIWPALLAAGAVPCGLGARDTLRLEAALPLYGHELDRTTNPFEAGLGWTVKLQKREFIGRAALLAIRERGIQRRLVGFRMEERGIARHGYPVLVDGQEVGTVTSGSYTPTVAAAIGMAYVPVRFAEVGQALAILVRGRPLAARVVPRPFYRRERAVE
ncbi:MAG: aminomethyltransferase [Dehalococcoidia bacterium]|nr:MAG: aminomethyltransferase [Dehalococcoidia bacterium]